MKWFYNLKISAKLLTGFIIVAIIAGVVGIVGITNIKTIAALDRDMFTRHTSTLDDLAVILRDYQMERATLRDLFILKDKNEQQKKIEEINSLQDEINISLKNFEMGIRDNNVRDSFNNLSQALSNFNEYCEKEKNLIAANQIEQASASLYSDGVQIAEAVQIASDNLLKQKVELAQGSADTNTNTASVATMTMIIVIIIAVLLAVALGIFISRLISKPVKELVVAADKLSLGDINVNVDATTNDEIGSLMKSFSKMIQNIRNQALVVEKMAAGDLTIDVQAKSENDLLGKKLSEMIRTNNEVLGNINSASEQVASGAKQVSQSSIMLSQGSTEQASSVEEITSSMTQVAAQTKQNAINANQANELAETAKDNAISGNRQMQEMVKAMAEINDSSSNISKIIKVIDEIAFQTNILALNAAVEAARAGQHGKGFAVVAEEVRNLAARSANAAKETTEMIEGSIKKVEVGTKLADETAAALNKIVENVTKAANLVSDIAEASDEQATGISQINMAIEQVAQVVQSNSATSEECAAASEELSGQAELLKEAVSRFRLKKSEAIRQGTETLSPEMLQAIEGILEKRKNTKLQQTYDEKIQTANINNKPKISLDDNNFGKY